MDKRSPEGRLAYTVDGACEASGLARTRIYTAISDGSLRSFLAGRRRMISAKALEAFIEALEKASEGRAAA